MTPMQSVYCERTVEQAISACVNLRATAATLRELEQVRFVMAEVRFMCTQFEVAAASELFSRFLSQVMGFKAQVDVTQIDMDTASRYERAVNDFRETR